MQVQAGARCGLVPDFNRRIAQRYEEVVGSIAFAVPQATPDAAGGQAGGCSHFYPGAVPTMLVPVAAAASAHIADRQ